MAIAFAYKRLLLLVENANSIIINPLRKEKRAAMEFYDKSGQTENRDQYGTPQRLATVFKRQTLSLFFPSRSQDFSLSSFTCNRDERFFYSKRGIRI